MIPQYVFSQEAVLWLKEHLGQDPSMLVLRSRHPEIRDLASQLVLWNKAVSKFPSWVDAGCIFHPVRLEQATAERLAAYKPYGSGTRAVDLTGGMGADTWALTRTYDHVICCEPDPETHRLLEINLERLGVLDRVSLHCMDAESCIRSGLADDADLIYVDPERRSLNGKRIHDLRNGSPDIVSLLPELRKRTSARILIKTSPMFDHQEATRLLPQLRDIYAMGYGGECREILLSEEIHPAQRRLHCRWNPHPDTWFTLLEDQEAPDLHEADELVQWLVEGDATLYAMRLFTSWAARHLQGASFSSGGGYAFTMADPRPVPVPVYEIIDIFPWKPRQIRDELNRRGIQHVMAGRRNFRLSTEIIRSSIGLPDGGSHFLKCTRIGNKEVAILCKKPEG